MTDISSSCLAITASCMWKQSTDHLSVPTWIGGGRVCMTDTGMCKSLSCDQVARGRALELKSPAYCGLYSNWGLHGQA